MFRQGYTHAVAHFFMPNFTSTPYTPGGTDRAYMHTSSTYQAPYTTVSYTDPIPLPGSLLGLLPNHAYQNTSRFNAYGQLEAGSFSYEVPPQFPFRPQLIDITPPRATAEAGTNSNNLTNQLATILCESFDIKSKGR
jgi:hypothetical protein